MYTKLERVGQGSYGVVYKGQNTLNKEIVALKKIRISSQNDGIPASAIREIALLKELVHPNIIRLYDVLHSQRKLTLVFEFCEKDLHQFLENNQLDLKQIRCFSKQLLLALEFIHKNSIIHRDVKPSNLLISRKFQLKLADFGLGRSTFIPVDQMSSEVVTQFYRPPEILLGCTKYGFEVDIWSAGCVIAEMLLKRPLFPCTNNNEQIEMMTNIFGTKEFEEVFTAFEGTFKEKIGLKSCFFDIPSSLLDLLQKMLCIDPAKRITASEALQQEFFSEE